MVDFLCLANSYKSHGRCVAGLRMDGRGWVRPITQHEHGTLHPDEYHARNGREFQLLDIISLDLVEACPTPYQPENWAGAFPADFVRRATEREAVALLDANLHTHEPLFGNQSDRVPQATLDDRPASYSLAVIQPHDVTIHVRPNYHGNKRGHAAFNFGHYEQSAISITDPAWQSRCRDLNFGQHTLADLGIIEETSRVLFIVSLTEPFQAHCYKVVAGITVL